jgi:hypothetical protein
MKNLFELLPTVYRLRDTAQGDELRALLSVVSREVQLVEDDIAQLYDNWFIETCDEWVVPYIADLLGARALLGSTGGTGQAAFSQRTYVANTLAYRRRKGTAAVLEQLAADVTGWRCKAVEFFELVATTQHANHPRLSHPFTPDVRSTYLNQFYGTPFERVPHLADVRHIDNQRGRYNVPNVGLFLWRLQSYLLEDVSARQVDAQRFTFDPLGRAIALFSVPKTEETITQATQPVNVPMPIARYTLHHDLPEYYGDATTHRSLLISAGGALKPVTAIRACDLSDAGTGWAHAAAAGKTAVDPELGRIAFDAAPATPVTVSYVYGFGGDLGGGPYDRRASVEPVLAGGVGWQMGVFHKPPASQSVIVGTLGDAIKEWNKQPPGTRGVIALMDSRTYVENLTGAAKRIKIPEGSQLAIVAAGWPAEMNNGTPAWPTGRLAPGGIRTHLQGTIEVVGTAASGSHAPGRLMLNGLLVEGAVKVLAGNLAQLDLTHCTLAPDAGDLTCADNPGLAIQLTRAICGALTPGPAARTLRLQDTIVTGNLQGGDVHADASTVLGSTAAVTLHASNSILLGKVTVQRRQVGCVRFSYLPLDSASPPRYRCQPENVSSASRVQPSFESTRFGDAAFVLLSAMCATEITSGADDEGEMGAWHFVQAPLRLRSLRLALDEYLRFGLEAGVFVVTESRAAATGAANTLTSIEPLSVRPRRAARTPRRPQ